MSLSDISISRCPHDKKNPYVMISKELVLDTSISPQAKGVLVYLLHLPDDWQIYHSHLQKALKIGEKYLNSCFAELIEAGYVSRTREKIKGVFQPYKYEIREFKIKVPNAVQQAGASRPVKAVLLSNKEQNTKKHQQQQVADDDDFQEKEDPGKIIDEPRARKIYSDLKAMILKDSLDAQESEFSVLHFIFFFRQSKKFGFREVSQEIYNYFTQYRLSQRKSHHSPTGLIITSLKDLKNGN